MLYHVAQKWDGKDLMSAAAIMGESEAIEMFCEKWDADPAVAADHVTRIFFYSRIEDARNHAETYGGEVLEIDDTWIETEIDGIEGHICTHQRVPASAIKRTN